MEKMTDLKDLLKHEIKDLYSAEEQIIQAMPRMIEKANNPQLKQGLQRHLSITENQLKRLEQVQQLMAQDSHEIQERKNSGLFARLMRRPSEGETDSGDEKCLGMEGLIREGEKVLAEEMEPSVLDAAIIACAQKIEHYEICGYGTARAYARELNMGEVAELLEQTLDEEYEADDRLTDMAIGKINEEAEMGDVRRSIRSSASSAAGRSSSRTTATKSATRSRAGAALAASGSRDGSGRSSSRSSSSRSGSTSSGRSAADTSRKAASSGRGASTSDRSTGRTRAATKTSSRGGSAAPAGKASASRSTTKSSGRGASTSKTRTAAASRSAKAPSKAAAAKTRKATATKSGRSSASGSSRTASKSSGRGSSNGRSAGRR
jgi:ferritin-like metal-binding protein YciE